MYTPFAVRLQSNMEFYHKTTILVQNKTVTAKIRGSHFHLLASFTLVQCSGAAESTLYGVVFDFLDLKVEKTIKVRTYNFAQVLRYRLSFYTLFAVIFLINYFKRKITANNV